VFQRGREEEAIQWDVERKTSHMLDTRKSDEELEWKMMNAS